MTYNWRAFRGAIIKWRYVKLQSCNNTVIQIKWTTVLMACGCVCVCVYKNEILNWTERTVHLFFICQQSFVYYLISTHSYFQSIATASLILRILSHFQVIILQLCSIIWQLFLSLGSFFRLLHLTCTNNLQSSTWGSQKYITKVLYVYHLWTTNDSTKMTQFWTLSLCILHGQY
jgi:hypothetical protein